jgi:uncharacterized protein (TIGR02466 family)
MDSNVEVQEKDVEFTIEGIFPVPVYFSQFRDLKKEEVEYIQNLDKKPNEGNTTSSNHHILEEEKFAELKEFVTREANKFFQFVWKPKQKDLKLYVTQSWSNYTEKGQWHHKHSHANSFISGVLYITVDEKFDRISFFNEREKQHFTFPIDDSNPNNYNPFNSISWWFPIKNSMLVMFKSDLPHMVPLIEESTYKGTRISISFNTYLRGEIGDANTLTQLIL